MPEPGPTFTGAIDRVKKLEVYLEELADSEHRYSRKEIAVQVLEVVQKAHRLLMLERGKL